MSWGAKSAGSAPSGGAALGPSVAVYRWRPRGVGQEGVRCCPLGRRGVAPASREGVGGGCPGVVGGRGGGDLRGAAGGARGRGGAWLWSLGRPEERAGDRGWSAGESAVRETEVSPGKGGAIWLNLPEEQANLED